MSTFTFVRSESYPHNFCIACNLPLNNGDSQYAERLGCCGQYVHSTDCYSAHTRPNGDATVVNSVPCSYCGVIITYPITSFPLEAQPAQPTQPAQPMQPTQPAQPVYRATSAPG